MATSANRDVPSTLAYCIATAILAGLGGYFLGQASNLGLFGEGGRKSGRQSNDAKRESENSDPKSSIRETVGEEKFSIQTEQDDSEEDDEEEQQELNAFEENANEECKLVLCVRTDLGMTKGKIVAQASHATLACYKTLLATSQTSPAAASLLQRWERYGQAKIAVQVKSEEELETLQATAMSLGICARIIHDAGRTQIAANSATVCGIGPAPKSRVDVVTGHLKLL